MYNISFSSTAEKQYKKLPSVVKPRIARAIATLSQDPNLGKKLGGELANFRSLRAWPYRIVYRVQKDKRQIEINYILHRQGAYK